MSRPLKRNGKTFKSMYEAMEKHVQTHEDTMDKMRREIGESIVETMVRHTPPDKLGKELFKQGELLRMLGLDNLAIVNAVDKARREMEDNKRRIKETLHMSLKKKGVEVKIEGVEVTSDDKEKKPKTKKPKK